MRRRTGLAIGLGSMLLVSGAGATGVGVYSYDPVILDQQQQLCGEQGPEPAEGCDQCLARALNGAQFARFCSPDYWCSDWDLCGACNGVCLGSSVCWENDGITWLLLHSPEIVDPVLIGCRQRTWQEYCPDAHVYGAYQKHFDISVNPLPYRGPRSDFQLESDAMFWAAVKEVQSLPGTSESERAWRQRAGIFAKIVAEEGGPAEADPFYLRAFLISVWVWVDLFEPDDLRPVDIGFPTDLPPPEVIAEAREIEAATCGDFIHFGDCGLTAAMRASWGTMKQRYR